MKLLGTNVFHLVWTTLWSILDTQFWINQNYTVEKLPRFNVDTTSYDIVRRRIEVETTSRVYSWVAFVT